MARTSVLPHALRIPALNKLANKRIVLASASPRRLDILKQFVGIYERLSHFFVVSDGHRRVLTRKLSHPTLLKTCPTTTLRMCTSIR